MFVSLPPCEADWAGDRVPLAGRRSLKRDSPMFASTLRDELLERADAKLLFDPTHAAELNNLTSLSHFPR